MSRRAIVAANNASATALRAAADGVGAAEAVIGLGMMPILEARWRDGQERTCRLVERALLRARAVSAVTNSLRASMTGAMVALGLALALNGMSSSGSMVAANMVLARLLMPFGGIAASRRQWVDALAAWHRIRKAVAESAPPRLTTALPIGQASIIVENLGFIPADAERPLLRGVSFTVDSGEAVAIVGPSSAGKTTLIRMILGMAPPTTGGVFLDGTSTYLWGREDFARHVGFVSQHPKLLQETIAENISQMQVPDLADVIFASKRAGVHRKISALPHGYATQLSGSLLSGGERQRLALARGLYHRPKLLLLDEPTAFLDDAGEADVLSLIEDLRREGVTVLVVTHRPALLKVVDKVLVLQAGMVHQFGPAAEVTGTLFHRPDHRPNPVANRIAAS